MLRRSVRNAALRAPVDHGPNPNGVQDASTSEPSRKRRRTKSSTKEDRRKKNVRGRRGALKGLVEMPMDILFEILGYLTLVDILRLYWTSKALRSILMSRSSAFAWKTARKNTVDFPDCPPFLNEPQYAAFMFDRTCDFCRETKTQTTLWDFTRCCRKCADDPDKFRRHLNIHYDIPSTAIPTVTMSAGGRSCYKYSLRSSADLTEEYGKVKARAKKQWRADKEAETRLRQDHYGKCKAWLDRQAAARSTELEQTRHRRIAAVRGKLMGLGWGKELEKLQPEKSHELDNLPMMRLTKDLTERTWESIKPDIIQWMEDVKAERLRVEFRATQKARRGILKQVYASFVASQPLHAILPPVADVAMTAPFKAVVDMSSKVLVTADHFAAAIEMLPDFVKRWRRFKDAKLLAVMKACKEIDTRNIQKSSLSLATTFFDCKRLYHCRAVLGYPHVFIHPCATCTTYSTREDAFKDLDCQPWDLNGDYLQFSHQWYKRARFILQACGLNPDTTTLEEVQNPTFFIECVGCNQIKTGEEGRTLMTWLSAMAHVGLHQDLRGDKSIRVCRAKLNDEELHRSIQLEADRRKRLTESRDNIWVCVRCKETYRWDLFLEHLKHNHQFNLDAKKPTEFEDYEFWMDTCTQRLNMSTQTFLLKPILRTANDAHE